LKEPIHAFLLGVAKSRIAFSALTRRCIPPPLQLEILLNATAIYQEHKFSGFSRAAEPASGLAETIYETSPERDSYPQNIE
jgi:hypothetical protein